MNTYFLVYSRNMILTSKQTFIQSHAASISASLGDYELTTADEVQKVMEQLDYIGVTSIVVTDSGGNVLYDPDGSFTQVGFPSEYIARALNGWDIINTRFTGGSFSSSAFTPVVRRGEITGAVYVHDEDPEQGSILIEMQTTIRNISIMVAILSVILVSLIIWTLMRRVTSILIAIKSVREGQYSYRITMSGRDELALLGDEFNSLTDRLRETDEIRRRFVADASHELKTPLASIRLLSDSILHNEGIQRETVHEFISDIGQEAERLSRTTGKLMTLTRLDSHVPDEKTCVDMKSAVVATLRMLKPLAVSKGLTLESELDECCYVLATDDSIHQVVFNLIENAIKYNKPDGSVYVRLRIEDAKSVVLTVDDRGVGVPDEDLPHIFERFYRVDKARSREAGGSGLGLSIVWDTVREFNGKVTAKRRVGGGMRFQASFDLYDKPK